MEIICDLSQVGQALTNLLQNSAESINGCPPSVELQPSGIIEVRILAGDHQVQVIVTDNGKGLPEDERDRLTEPYVTTRDKGTGLGLAITHRITRRHRGTLEFGRSENLGGAEFRIWFPTT